MDKMIEYVLNNTDQEKTVYVLTVDHLTPCNVRDHTGDLIPIAIMGPQCRVDDIIKL